VPPPQNRWVFPPPPPPPPTTSPPSFPCSGADEAAVGTLRLFDDGREPFDAVEQFRRALNLSEELRLNVMEHACAAEDVVCSRHSAVRLPAYACAQQPWAQHVRPRRLTTVCRLPVRGLRGAVRRPRGPVIDPPAC
jgi:hypothetical protein